MADCDLVLDDDTDVGASALSTAPPQPTPRGSGWKRILTVVSMTAIATAAFFGHSRTAATSRALAASSLTAVPAQPRTSEAKSEQVLPTLDALAAKAGSDPKKAKPPSSQKANAKHPAKAKPSEKSKVAKRPQKSAPAPRPKKR